MPGTFTVIGTFRITGRGFVVYGDLTAGDVRIGEVLIVPLDDGTPLPIVVRSVESMDGPRPLSYIALVVDDTDTIRNLPLAGRTLTISRKHPAAGT